MRLVIPVKGGFGIGGDAYLFRRDNDFVFTDSISGREKTEHVRQRSLQARVYLVMTSRRRVAGCANMPRAGAGSSGVY